MSCDLNHLLSAYHDGELSSADTERVEQHLASCPPCAAELDELRAVSRLMITARRSNLGEPSDEVMDRLRVHVRQLVDTSDYGLLRIARLFTGLAASVLIAGLWLLHSAAPTGSPVKPAPGPRFAAQESAGLQLADVLPIADPAQTPEPTTREAILEKLIGVEDPTLSSNRGAAGEDELP